MKGKPIAGLEGSVLVIAAHPDDELLGCGGTIARLALAGQDVHIAIFGEGITSRQKARDDADSAELDTLHTTAHQVAHHLGAVSLDLFKLPDNRFDTVPMLEVAKQIEELIERYQPRVVFTHSGGDLNVDHVVLHRATLTATRPMEGHPVKDVYCYEVASSTEWTFQQFSPVFRPSLFVDISEQLERKVEGMALYESEAREFPHPRSGDALRAIARRWGTVVGLQAAEAFELIRSVR
ncbi:PIG-L family deacetylase [bacterium]|nr:PIG-L family deacetylase [bacterium]